MTSFNPLHIQYKMYCTNVGILTHILCECCKNVWNTLRALKSHNCHVSTLNDSGQFLNVAMQL